MELTQGQFHIKKGQSSKDEEHAVGHQEGATTVLVADIGKSPDISQVNGKANHGQEELGLLTPSFSSSFSYGDNQNALES